MNTDPFIIKEGDVKDANLKDYQKIKEEGNFFNFRQTEQVQRLGQFIDLKKLKVIKFIALALLLIILGRIFYLQIIKGEDYRLLAEGNRIRLEKQKAQRGIFYDRFGKILVYNKPTFSFYLTPTNLKNNKSNEELLKNLNAILKLSDEQLSNLIKLIQDNKNHNYLPILIKEGISYEDAIYLKIKTQTLPDFAIYDEAYRYYPSGLILTHLLGYLGRISEAELTLDKNSNNYSFNDKIGKTGLEFIYEKSLKGVDGYQKIEVDSQGREKKVISQQNSLNGKNFILTIDLDLQNKLYQTLERQLKRINCSKAAAIALNPQNGEILALVSFPSYDNNLFSIKINEADYQKLSTNENQPLFNRAISGEYPSGSTIKLAVAAAALEEGIIDKNSQILSTGGIKYGDWFFPDWKAGGHGLTNIIKALAESVNTFFYLISIDEYQNYRGLGIDRLVDYLKKFNFGKLTNIDLLNEKSGFIPTPEWKEREKQESWYPGDTLHLAIGQGDLLVTPLQIALLTSFFAANGNIYQPHLVKEIFTNETKKIIQPQKIVSDIIKPTNIDLVRMGMKAATSWGSARSLANLPIETAGKTGTAQVSGNKSPHAWFTVFAPFTNPEIVLTIIIENGGEGSSTAIPVANEVLNWYFSKK